LETVSLVDLIKESTLVAEVGRRHKAHCPFHASNDNKETLFIDNDKQRFDCGVCRFHGTAIGWLMHHDGLTFQDSIYILADRADVDITQWITPQSINASRNQKRQFISEIENFYAKQLRLSEDASVYLQNRSLSGDTISRFGIGFAPDDQKIIELAFPNRGRTLWNEGLFVRNSDGSYRQRFRNRIMFPIRDTEGLTVGFGGRSLGSQLPKYINSPASPTFSKSDLLYGLYESLESPGDNDRFILVEGYTDVLTLHQAGFSGAVATLGTSPSESHLDALYSIGKTLVVCFDGDAAGVKAAERLLYTALPFLQDDHVLLFVKLPEGLDPDSIIRDNGNQAFSNYLDSAIDLNTIGGKSKLAAVARPYVNSVNSKILRDTLVSVIESSIGIPWFDDLRTNSTESNHIE